MRLFTAQEMQAADRAAAARGVALVLLMERAGQAVAQAALDHYSQARHVLVLCGKGNNGGDGYVATRHLLLAGRQVAVLELASSQGELGSDESRTMRAAWLAYEEARTQPLTAENLRAHLERADLVIDGLFGSGLSRPLEGELAEIVGIVNESRVAVLSIDVPSGLSSDGGEPIGPAIQADYTVQLAGAKMASAFYPAREYFGDSEVADIGIPADVLKAHAHTILLDHGTVRAWLPRRQPDAHKYRVGTVLVIAGSERYGGAAQLASRAALRAGAGLVTLATTAKGMNSWPELILESLEAWNEAALERILSLSENRRQKLVVGPGLADEAKPFLPRLLKTGVPAVLDATALAGDDAWLEAVREHGKCVLTPHAGEAAPLLGLSAEEIQRETIKVARALAERTNAVVVLKGRPTVIAAASGQVAVSPSGNAGMASGGTGDVLAGLLGAWLSEENIFERSCAAVYAHGLAGDLACEGYGDGLIASDLIERFPRAWLAIERS